jgi:hypothetical protein
MSILKILKNNNIKYVCADKNTIIKYELRNGEMKKQLPPKQYIFNITGKKDKIDKDGNIIKGDYPKFSNEDFGEYGYALLYTGCIGTHEPIIIGVDLDDYRDIPLKDKLEKFGFDWENCKDYKWITKSAKGGVHIIVKYSPTYDITTSNIRHTFPDGIERGRGCDIKSEIDMRGTGGKLILAGSKSSLGNYEWINGTPTDNDILVPLGYLNPDLLKSIKAQKTISKKHYEKIVREDKKNKTKPNTPLYKKKESKTYSYDLEVVKCMLNKLEFDSEEYTDWNIIGMCLHNEFNGSEEGLEMFKHFSQLNPKYDEQYINVRWKYWTDYHIDEKYPNLNSKTIYTYARERTGNNNIYNEVKSEASKNVNGNVGEDTEDIFLDKQYIIAREQFEKVEKVYRVGGTFRRIRRRKGDLILQILKRQDLLNNYENYPKIAYVVEGKRKFKSFIHTWLQDPYSNSYYDCEFSPSKPAEFEDIDGNKIVNEFFGFRGEKKPKNYNPTDEKKELMIDTFNKQLKMLCENNEEYFKYTLHYIRKMFVYPEQKKMNVMINFMSDTTGLGKGTMIELLFEKMIGKQYATSSSNIHKFFSQFSQMRHNKIAFCLDEANMNDTKKYFERLKNCITETEDDLELKGEQSIDSDNIVHMFSTCNDPPIKITETDRRNVLFFGVPLFNEEEYEKQKTLWYDFLEEDEDFGYVIYDYITKDNSWVDKNMGRKYYDFGKNIPKSRARNSIIEMFMPVEIQFLKYIIENNFADLVYNIKKIADPYLIRKYYCIIGNDYAINTDFRLESLDNINSKDYDNTDDKYKDAMDKLEEIVINSPLLELEKPYNEYNIKTPLKNKRIKEKSLILQKEYLQMLSIDTEFMEFFEEQEDYKFESNRNKDNEYIRIELSFFINKMNWWRKSNNCNESKKTAFGIKNSIDKIFNQTTIDNLVDIHSNNGKYYFAFNKQLVLDRILNKYK